MTPNSRPARPCSCSLIATSISTSLSLSPSSSPILIISSHSSLCLNPDGTAPNKEPMNTAHKGGTPNPSCTGSSGGAAVSMASCKAACLSSAAFFSAAAFLATIPSLTLVWLARAF